ncbi:helix-turn-helix transcriptional regulator [Microbacterium sp. ET2]|uniref:helix-turn-helix domain-containing protein n=1 Tax=Microbacterium albipurpureum TaxID=3050384 RepID=UPI00259CB145|nr:helix-turn-helix transcriptional regulator [Microbacterium sp. ET2 (Ac-2212)]WJL94774.1 helix-turn-helix transcriptional regulator [Microbacterium sp. ET2 (Ac-2212)]
MSQRPSALRTRRMATLGENLRSWRKVQRLTAAMVAERAGINRTTLRAIEEGSGSVKLENLFAVLEVLGIDDAVIAATDPVNDDRGRLLLVQGLPQRVRP